MTIYGCIVESHESTWQRVEPSLPENHEDHVAGNGFTSMTDPRPKMTAAKVMDVFARLPDCDGQAADAISAYTQVKLEDAPRLLKSPNSECPDVWIRLPRHKWPKLWSTIVDPGVPFERSLYGHPLAGLLWERQFEEVLLELRWERVPNKECLFIHRKQ